MAQATPATVRKQIASGTPDSIYLLQGQDEVEKGALAADFADLVEEDLRAFNVERIHAGDMTTGDRIAEGVAAVVSAVRTLPMMAPRRVVIVLQADVLLAPKRESDAAARALASLEALFKAPDPQTTLVLVAGTIDRRGRMFKLLQKQATLVECGVLENAADAERWIRTRVSAAGADIDPAAARLMAELAGFGDRAERSKGELSRLRAEVDRLLLYAMGQQRITLADVREVAGGQALKDDWAIANAIEAGNAADALRQIAMQLDAGAAPEPLLGQIAWVVRSKFPQIAPASLDEAIAAVFRADQELKRSNRSSDQPRILLERLVVELCAGKRARAAGRPGWR